MCLQTLCAMGGLQCCRCLVGMLVVKINDAEDNSEAAALHHLSEIRYEPLQSLDLSLERHDDAQHLWCGRDVCVAQHAAVVEGKQQHDPLSLR